MPDPILFNLTTAAAVVFALIFSVWVIHLIIDDASIIDLIWGAGFGLVSVVLLTLTPAKSEFKILLAALPLVWSIRYTTFIVHRNVGHGEDDRYTKLREKTKGKGIPWPLFSFFCVYGFQAVAMLTVCAPLIIGLAAPESTSPGIFAWVGTSLWLFGVLFEATGDLQLELFKKKHRNYSGSYEDKPVLDQGLWRYTRHPNYFGNACLWWGIGIVALSAPYGWIGLIGPAFMNFALVYLTGKANNESKMQARTGYRDYVERTSGFFPMPPED